MNIKTNEFLESRSKLNNELFTRPQSLGQLLTYQEYIEEHGVFVNKDGTLGAIYELKLVEHEPKNAEEIIDFVQGTKAIFQVPNNCVVQVIHEQKDMNENDKAFSQAFDAYPYSNRLSDLILEQRVKKYKENCFSESKYSPRLRKTYFTIKYYPTKKNQNLYKDMVISDSENLFKQIRSFIHDLNGFNQILNTFEENMKVTVSKVSGDGLLCLLRDFFNPKSSRVNKFPCYNPKVALSEQAIYNAPRLNHEGIEREGLLTRTITLKNCPKYSLPGGMANFLKLDFPFKVSLNFSLPEEIKIKRGLKLKGFFLERTESAEARKLKQDLDMVQEKLAHKDRCLQMTFCIIVEGESKEQLDMRTRKVLSLFFNELDCEVVVDDYIGLGLCLNSLPLMYSPETDLSTQRSIKILQSDAQNFLPIFDSYRGGEDPMQFFISRENNLVPFSILDKERTSNHTCVVADTGSGKSSLVADIVQSYKRRYPDPLIFYVEKRASSKMLCKYFGGESTAFKIGDDISFSPFKGHFDDEKVNFLSLFITTAMKLSNPNFVVESEHSRVIQKALKQAHQSKIENIAMEFQDGALVESGEQSQNFLSMDDVVNAIGSLHDNKEFSSLKKEIDDCIHKLRDYYGDGKYAGYFSRGSSADQIEKSFFVYDLDGLESDPTLQALVTLAIFEEIRRVISMPGNEGRSGLIVFEEMGQLGKNNPTAARYIVDFAETIRKLGFWLVSIAPRPQNFFETEAGRATWGAADNYLFMAMKPDSINYVKENSAVLNDVSFEIVKSLRTAKGKYADVYYTNKDNTKSGAFRFLRTDIDRWLIPNKEDETLVNKYLEKSNQDAVEVLKQLLIKDKKEVE